ncbi:MAG: response regulator transcription factor, partial [Clostridiaceae bacterium]|nr:response regulator transcription factor [Clostridiaceae bacterium]
MTKKILIVEDEKGLLLTLVDRLETEGYTVQTAEDGITGLQKVMHTDYDILLLDIMLPGKDGFEIASKLRASGNSKSIIFITAKNQLEDKITGFKTGADDYVCKPFEMKELLARIEALLRRSAASKQKTDDLVIDLEHGFVIKRGKKENLLTQEIKLLQYFYEHEGQIILRSTLLSNVWGYDSNMSTRT